MQHGSVQLAAWLKRSGMNQREAAKHLGIHWTVLNKLLKGTRLPGRNTAIDLQATTGIPVVAWTTRVAKVKKRKRASAKYANVGGAATHV